MEENAKDSTQQRIVIQEVQTRFLYPFLFKSNHSEEMVSVLAELVHRGQRVWDCAAPPDLYSGDLLENVSDYLFPENGTGCSFLKVPHRFLNSWFRSGIPMQTAKGRMLTPAVSCSAIELFLSPYGAGVLSLTLIPSLVKPEGQGFDQDDVKEVNYRGSQLRSRNRPTFTIPAAKANTEIPSPPSPTVDISERLGATGSVFNLGELRDFLIGPLLKLASCHEPQKNQFSTYTVVRLGKEADFEMSDLRHELGPFLAGLAQLEEAQHVGAPRGQINVANRVLNAKHWIAVSSLGAAHLIADQGTWELSGPSVPFDAQRLQIVRDRYFIPYLLAYFQRLNTLRIAQDAQRALRHLGQEDPAEHTDANLRSLRLDMLRFMVCSNFPEISNREALNLFYDLARQGLRVPESMEIAKEAIADFNAANEAELGREMNEKLGRNVETVTAMSEELRQNIEIVAAVQTKVEWLEVFFVSFYAAELSNLIAESFSFNHSYKAVTVTAWAIVAGLIAVLCLRPWQHSKGEHREGRKLPSVRTLLLAALVLLVVWAGFGWRGRTPHPAPESSAPHGQLSSEHPSAEGRLP